MSVMAMSLLVSMHGHETYIAGLDSCCRNNNSGSSMYTRPGSNHHSLEPNMRPIHGI
jgi:hypothetical protein